MVERAVSVAEDEVWCDGLEDEGLGLLNGFGEADVFCEERRDGGCECASCAVGVGGVDARLGESVGVCAGVEDVDAFPRGERGMSAFDERRGASESGDEFLRRGFQVSGRGLRDRSTQELFRLGEIRGDEGRAR